MEEKGSGILSLSLRDMGGMGRPPDSPAHEPRHRQPEPWRRFREHQEDKGVPGRKAIHPGYTSDRDGDITARIARKF